MSDSSFSACAVCQTRTNLLRCSRCKVVKYCSKEHQIQDWPNHKHQCTLLQSTYHNTTNENPTISGYDPPLLEKIELNRNLEMLMTTSPIKGNMILKSQRGEIEMQSWKQFRKEVVHCE